MSDIYNIICLILLSLVFLLAHGTWYDWLFFILCCLLILKNCLWEFFVDKDESAFLQKEFTVTRCLGNHFQGLRLQPFPSPYPCNFPSITLL